LISQQILMQHQTPHQSQYYAWLLTRRAAGDTVDSLQLFEGVFGASDEVLGAIGSGVDFDRRIADIYQNCRDPDAIKASFEQLQLDLSGEISEAMVKTRQILLENFDEEVQDKLRVRAEDSRAARSKYERMLMDLTRAELADCATFDDDGFVLQSAPEAALDGIDLGRYELPRRSGDAHLYRIGHPLAVWVAHQAKIRELPSTRLRQKKQRELEGKRSKLRRELFARQDEVEAQRNDLISQLEVQLQQRVEERTLFTVEWELK